MNGISRALFIALLLALLTSGITWPWLYGGWEAEGDYRKILADKDDSLKEEFHANNALVRGLVILAGSAVVFALLVWLLSVPVWFLPAYFLYCSAAFGLRFTTQLNTLRGLHPFYVSRAPRASKTDQFFVRMGTNWGMPPHQVSRILHTGFLVVTVLIIFIVLWINN